MRGILVLQFRGGQMKSASLLMLGFVVVSAVVQTFRNNGPDR